MNPENNKSWLFVPTVVSDQSAINANWNGAWGHGEISAGVNEAVFALGEILIVFSSHLLPLRRLSSELVEFNQSSVCYLFTRPSSAIAMGGTVP